MSQSCPFPPYLQSFNKGSCWWSLLEERVSRQKRWKGMLLSQSAELLVTQAVVHSPLGWKTQGGRKKWKMWTVPRRDFWIRRLALSLCLFPSSKPRVGVGQCPAVSTAELASTGSPVSRRVPVLICSILQITWLMPCTVSSCPRTNRFQSSLTWAAFEDDIQLAVEANLPSHLPRDSH